jgi:hypothetical protein
MLPRPGSLHREQSCGHGWLQNLKPTQPSLARHPTCSASHTVRAVIDTYFQSANMNVEECLAELSRLARTGRML